MKGKNIMNHKDESKQLFVTIMVSSIAAIIPYLINFFLTPYITNNIGVAAYGFISLANTFGNYAMIAATAVNSYSSRYITVEYHKGNYAKANCFLSSTYFSNIFLAVSAIIFAIVFTAKIDFYLTVPKNLILDVRILFLLTFLNFGITNIGTSLSATAYVVNRLDISALYKATSNIVEAGVLLLLYSVIPANAFFVGIALCIKNTFVLLANLSLQRKFTPELRIKKKDFSLEAVKELVGNGIWNSINSLGNTLNTGLDLIICNLMLSDLAMGQLAVAKTINTMFVLLFQTISQPFQPLFLKSYADANKNKLLKQLNFSSKVSGMFANLAFAGFTSLGITYYKLWISGQKIMLIYKLTEIGCFSAIFEGAIYPLYYIYTLKIKNRVPCIITLIGGIINVVSMYFLINFTSLGIYSVVLTTAIIMSFISLITNPLYMAHCMEVKPLYFYPCIIRNMFSCSVMTIVFRFIAGYLNPASWVMLIFSAVIMIVLGGIIQLLIAFNSMERKHILNILQRKIKNKK